MKKKPFIKGMMLFFFLTFLSSFSLAGEVVTKDVRQWAKEMLEQEKTLRPIRATKTLAILYFENKTGQAELDPLQKGLALMLITDLSTLRGFQVVERVRLQALIEELGLGASGLIESATVPRAGRLLGAQWLIAGEILRGSIEIRSNLLNVSEEKIVEQPFVKGDLPDLFRMEKDLLFKIIKLLKIELTPEDEKELSRPCSTNTKALMELFKGINASDRRDYETAAEFYKNALQEDGTICVAGGALEELKRLHLIGGKKKSQDLLRSLRDRSSLTDQITPEDSTKREKSQRDIRPIQTGPIPTSP